jgi:hypothetical protein
LGLCIFSNLQKGDQLTLQWLGISNRSWFMNSDAERRVLNGSSTAEAASSPSAAPARTSSTQPSLRTASTRPSILSAKPIPVQTSRVDWTEQATFTDLGPTHYDNRAGTQRAIRNHIRGLNALGYQVTLQPAA